MMRLNNYLYKANEPLYNRENLEKLKKFIKTGYVPQDLNERQYERFINRFKHSYYTVKDNKVYY